MTDAERLLRAYDEQLRDEAEVRTADTVDRDGPLLRAVYDERGFVTYRDLAGIDGAGLDDLIARTVDHYRAMPQIESFEWKSRGHDAPADLAERLERAGFVAEDRETVMVGEAQALAVVVEIPDEVSIRRIDLDRPDDEVLPEVTRAAQMSAEVFGGGPGGESTLRRLRSNPRFNELWVAEVGGEVICAGRLEVIDGTEFAGVWGGSCRPEWRGKGIYRALTAARARSALDLGAVYIHSDSTDMSRPILERSGLIAVTTTTPYVWTRDEAGGIRT